MALNWSRFFILCVLWFAQSVCAQAANPNQSQVLEALARREALFDRRDLDIRKLSQEITAAVRDGEKLETEGKYQQALDRLLMLEKYLPLPDIPSFDVHMLAGWLLGKLGRSDESKMHRERAAAHREVLANHLGGGATPDDPLRVVMMSEAVDWTKSRLAQIRDARTLPHRGKDLIAVSYQGPMTGNQSRQLFVLVDDRTRAMMTRNLDRFTAIPVGEMRPQLAAALEQARELRTKFLTDASFRYLELDDLIKKRMNDAIQLDTENKPSEALAKLREIETVRSIELIPTPRLLSLYSYLIGKTGNVQKQQELRSLIFGVQQAIAHSGDGRSPETAIHVVFISEEYDYLDEKKLRMRKQRLLETGAQRYDVLTVQDLQGNNSDVYFNITKLYARYAELLEPAKK